MYFFLSVVYEFLDVDVKGDGTTISIRTHDTNSSNRILVAVKAINSFGLILFVL